MPMSHARLLAAVVATSLAFTPIVNAAQPPGFILAASDGIMVHEAWARASAGAATTGAAYLTLMGGDQPDRLVSVSTPAADKAELHETIADKGVMKMRPVQGVPIPGGAMVTFSPGGYHVMLMGLKKPLVAGQSFPLTLTFEHAAPMTVDVQVRPLGASGGAGGGAGHGGGMSGMKM